jgi:hypothetical protein
MQHEQYII